MRKPTLSPRCTPSLPKGVYKEINALLEPEEGVDLTDLKTKYEAVLDQLPTMDELYRKRLVLRKARAGWGS